MVVSCFYDVDYLKLTQLYESLAATSKRLAKTQILADFFSSQRTYVSHLFYLVQGRIFPDWDERKIGVASRLVIKALCRVTGATEKKISTLLVKYGDLGLVAEALLNSRAQTTLASSSLTVVFLYKKLCALVELSGDQMVERKVQLLSELFSNASGVEAKYLVRTILDEMRIGLGEGGMRDALLWAYFSLDIGLSYAVEKNVVTYAHPELAQEIAAEIQRAYDLTCDFAEVVRVILESGRQGLSSLSLAVGKPVKVMLYLKADSLASAFEKLGPQVAIEYKFDGFRCEVHKKGDEVLLFTRRLENVTAQFPDVVTAVRKSLKVKEGIFDGEVIGFDPVGKRWVPFQKISQRILRKHGILAMAQQVPVVLQLFDVLSVGGKTVLDEPFSSRRALLVHSVTSTSGCQIAEQLVTSSLEKAHAFYEKSLSLGNEGVMVKSLSSVYQPGARIGFGMKVKPTLETLDLVIIGATWGSGKRSSAFSSFAVACRDRGSYLSLGMVGSGVKEKKEQGLSFSALTALLTPLITARSGTSVDVRPQIIVEVACEEIQQSPTYAAGFALRFPRILRLRPDKALTDVTSLRTITQLHASQRARHL